MLEENILDNRRQYRRLDIDATIDYKKFSFEDLFEEEDNEVVNINSKKNFIRTKLKNVSPKGIFFESTKRLELGSIVKVSIDLPGWGNYRSEYFKGFASSVKPLTVLATVIRVEELFGQEIYGIALKFSAIDTDHQKAIAKFIHDKLELPFWEE